MDRACQVCKYCMCAKKYAMEIGADLGEGDRPEGVRLAGTLVRVGPPNRVLAPKPFGFTVCSKKATRRIPALQNLRVAFLSSVEPANTI